MRIYTKEESRKIAEAITETQSRRLGRNQMEYLRRVLENGTTSGVVYVYSSYSSRIRESLIKAGILIKHPVEDEYVVSTKLIP